VVSIQRKLTLSGKLNRGTGGGGRRCEECVCVCVCLCVEPGRRCQWKPHTRGASSQSAASPPCQVHSPARCAPKMMAMNGKQHFSMHPALHPSSEGMRRVCLPAPQVRLALNSSYCLHSVTLRCFELLQLPSLPPQPLLSFPLTPSLPHPHAYPSKAAAFILIFMTCAFEEGAWECSLIQS